MKDHIHGAGRKRIWSVLYTSGNASRDESITCLGTDLHISPVTARLLYNRGYTTPETARLFMTCGEDAWHDPFRMKDMDMAVHRVLEAIREGEKIAIYGDYDVDGVTSVTSLQLYLEGKGAHVMSYIPSRAKEGYGMSMPAMEKLADAGVKLIITVDTGVTANREIAYARELGMDTVVTDHHECHDELPSCVAVVNPHRPDCDYPFKELAGVGVVFKLICACEAGLYGLSKEAAFAQIGGEFIDLVAIGTVADVMPLCDENRFIVSRGLTALEHTKRPGLEALLDAISGNGTVRPASGVAAAKPRRKVNAGLVGYGIAPRINAAGRISHAMKAVNLLLASSEAEAIPLAEELCSINTQRQAEENRIAEQAYRMIEDQLAEAANPPGVLVLEDDGWIQGIVGIVASRITEKYGLPSILISFDGAVMADPSEDDIGKGSGRSVKGLNLVDALADSRELLLRFGGHELAAGLTVRRGNVQAFREKINEYASQYLTPEMTAVRYEAECEVRMEELTMTLAQEIEVLEPFGVSNPQPVFMLKNAVVQKVIPMGNGKHTKLALYADGYMMQAVWFGMPASRLPVVVGDTADVLFQLNINEYQGVRSLQMILQDVRMSEDYIRACHIEENRFKEIIAGAILSPSENVMPTRDDIACVYTLLRGDARLGYHTFMVRDLLSRIKTGGGTLNYVKLRLCLRILDQLGVCSIRESGDGVFVFDVNFSAPKTNVESAPLYQQLKAQRTEA
ncbi:MAG: single-stranded-DNA-specific exonuclease RecJ [Ruminococcaceae bacterium]|nr:single-stranded-DNA-specific exonuclease RecJ [Oscillospiraceae bacterium]